MTNVGEILTRINSILSHTNVTYLGDLSDVGNEIGYAIGQIIENMTQEEIDAFITGFKHGVSLTNGTH